MTHNPLTRWWRSTRPDLVPLGIYLLLVLLIAIPVLGQFGTHTITSGGDSHLWLWMGWWRRTALLNGFDPTFIHINQVPFGTDHAFRPYLGTVAGIAFWSSLMPPPAALNMMVLGAYFLSATFSYYSARQLGINRAGAFCAGLVFGFSAYMIVHSRAHVDQSQQWVIPLFFLSLLNLHHRRTWLSAILMGAALGFSMHMHAYYGYFNSHIAVAFVLYEGVRRGLKEGWRGLVAWDYIPLYAVGALFAALIYLPEALSIAQDLGGTSTPLRTGSVLERPKSWFFDLSVRLWDFFLPYTEHPLFGTWSEQAYDTIETIDRSDFTPAWFGDIFPTLGSYWYWQRSDDPFSNDRYLGYATLALAVWMVAIWRTNRRHPKSASGNQHEVEAQNYWLPLLIILFVLGILFAQPPWFPLGGFIAWIWEPLRDVAIPMPSWFTMTFVSPLRVVARFVLLSHLALAMLVGFGIQQIGQRWQNALAAAAVFSLLFGFEHLYLPPVYDYRTPAAYDFLDDVPDDVAIMGYPFGSWAMTYYQTQHRHPIVDSSAGISSNLVLDNIHTITARSMGSPFNPDAAGKLAARGVQYAFDHSERNQPYPDGFDVIDMVDGVTILEINAEPTRLVVLHTLTMGLWQSDATWASSTQETTVYVWNPLSEAVMVHVTVDTAGNGGSQLLAERVLAPQPDRIYYSGYRIDNPTVYPDYDPTPITLEAPGTTAMMFQPGETTLTLRWNAPDHPTLMDITFACSAGTCVP